VKILIVEDETGLRDSIEAYFTGSDSVCETANDFTSALAKVSVYRYDCIILDLTLPHGNGLNIVKHLKENNHNDGVLIISAKDSLDDRLTGLDLGADDYLTKPFHLSELKSRVTAIVRRRSFNGSNNLKFNEIEIDRDAKSLNVQDAVLKLTRIE
jgi:DNA-binding response OmpR family regulator